MGYTAEPVPGSRDPIAVVGIGCRFPGGVDSPESYWELMATGRDVLVDIPRGRWQVEKFYDP
jgi:acyl transferase domain-containing protein